MSNKIMKDGLDIGAAVAAAFKGLKVAREGWNGKGMFVFARPEDDLPINILSLSVLPKCVKDYYEAKHQPILPGAIPLIKFKRYLCLKAADDSIVNGWVASQEDMAANDWVVLK